MGEGKADHQQSTATGDVAMIDKDASNTTRDEASAADDEGSPDQILDPNAKAFQLTRAGDIAALKDLVGSHPDVVRARDSHRQTLLHVAAGMGHESIMTFLLKAGADVNATSNGDFTPLHRAASSSGPLLLLQSGANLESRDLCGMTPLMWACRTGKLSTVTDLFMRSELPDVHAHDRRGMTALLWACMAGADDIVDMLLEHGSNPNVVTVRGQKVEDLTSSTIILDAINQHRKKFIARERRRARRARKAKKLQQANEEATAAGVEVDELPERPDSSLSKSSDGSYTDNSDLTDIDVDDFPHVLEEGRRERATRWEDGQPVLPTSPSPHLA